jgi:hypothetical protein
MKLFDQTKPRFVSVKEDSFVIDQRFHPTIRCLIQKAQPIRKLFRQGRLVCYSMDGKLGLATKTYCVFCDDAFQCQRKVRLSMILLDHGEPRPVVLDLNHGSFAAFEQLLDAIGHDQLKDTPVAMKIVCDHHDRRAIEFTPD